MILCLLRHLAALRPSLPDGVTQVELAAITPYNAPAQADHPSLAWMAKPGLGQAGRGRRSVHGDGLPGARGRCRHAEHGANNYRFDMGFLDRKQMNVALSRARRLLVVVGCFRMLEERAKSHEVDDSFVAPLVQELRP